mmetsp:Transcript_32832/g.93173  ORF Transcript_32832/g.93173 Transcript_32832/m.93173 type:complete len:679 (+) Transcript_32832:145-2181(+)|eukprot:CAMPEP_0117665586 /NCGR_PEP_ID=MMETSP0804-20121206/9897_1 /TAXON_ID=1074897 /ORGANISM="Tetraselmis astigmatica, Strain CCMP880" /LENGTH=678 /DNA_ID=CAMNT_0005473025 /DNA_START=139 /DNA_END=2175 /DNA_ORIENTATION=+
MLRGSAGPRPAPAATVKGGRQKKKNRKGLTNSQAIAKKNKEAQYRDSDSEGSADFSDSDNEGTEGYRKGGYHPVRIGEKYKDGRYAVLKKLGWGHFSTVWLVHDQKTGQHVAMKVQKSASHYTDAAVDEIELLNSIRDGAKGADTCCVELVDSFSHRGPYGLHMCMVFEALGDNLLSLIKRYQYRGLPLPLVKRLAHDMLKGLDYLHRECNIIHTDLKPENVMLSKPLVSRGMRRVAPQDEAPLQTAMDDAQGELAVQQPIDGEQPSAEAEAHCPLEAPAAVVVSAGNGGQQAEELSAVEEAEVEEQQQGDAPALTKNQRKKLKKKQRKGKGDGPAVVAPAATPAPPQRGAAPAVCPTQHIDTRECLDPSAEDWERWHCKLVDFGNACWTDKQLTTDIQTRQYRCPEAMLGAKYSTSADMWSLACIIFELVTGDLLFDPRSGEKYSRDEDHLALFMELLGRMPRQVALSGKYSKDYFNRNGELRNIKKLRFWPLHEVLSDKYEVPIHEARLLASFLTPMLDFVPENRATASESLMHPWLTSLEGVREEKPLPSILSLPEMATAAALGGSEEGGELRQSRQEHPSAVKPGRSLSPERGGAAGGQEAIDPGPHQLDSPSSQGLSASTVLVSHEDARENQAPPSPLPQTPGLKASPVPGMGFVSLDCSSTMAQESGEWHLV